MSLQLVDTIVALATAPGRGGRAIVRLSGPAALSVAECAFHSPHAIDANSRQIYSGFLALSGVSSPIPAELYLFPAPRSYTGQTVVEIHLLSAPPLVEQLVADLLAFGARAAQPGEFTMRAFVAGKLDLPRAEAILGTIEATDRDELRASLHQLAGGVTRPLDGLRDDLLNLLADLEAALDFADEDHEFVAKPQVLMRLAKAMAQVTLLQKQMSERSVPGRPFRVAIVGPPNAGKSTLFNTLSGAAALVSPMPGTTRDYLVAQFELAGQTIELIDTAGARETDDEVERAAHSVGREAITRVDLILNCRAGSEPAHELSITSVVVVPIATKVDVLDPPPGMLAISAVRGDGMEQLRDQLTAQIHSRRDRGLAPSLSRCSHHVDRCLEHLRKVHQTVLFDEPAEVATLDLRAALDDLGEMTGTIYTDDLLDRVFSRFCIGK